MLATSTHDTKRSEDVRARLYLLSEIPAEWGDAVRQWSELNAKHWRGEPDREAEYLLYQTLLGAWPISLERVNAYIQKALRESKRHTSWIDPNLDYEKRISDFIEAILDDSCFLAPFEGFVTPLIRPGRINSLSQTLLKLTAPGVPDIYQGCELWNLRLVDPDNRGFVDYALRRSLLEQAKSIPATGIWRLHEDSGMPKLWLIHRALQVRLRRPELFGEAGEFRSLEACGAMSDHVVAYSRGGCAVTVAPRLILGVGSGWKDTSINLPPTAWTNELTGEVIPGGPIYVDQLLKHFPVALLTSETT